MPREVYWGGLGARLRDVAGGARLARLHSIIPTTSDAIARLQDFLRNMHDIYTKAR